MWMQASVCVKGLREAGVGMDRKTRMLRVTECIIPTTSGSRSSRQALSPTISSRLKLLEVRYPA